MPFRVLFVCTGNICRSPAAELLMRAHVAPDAAVEISSAGTHGLVGRGVDGPTGLALRERGVDPSGHQGRWLEPPMITASDLVLTATTVHRSVVLQTEPLMMSQVFTLREFARLAEAARLEPPERSAGAPTGDGPAARVAAIARLRGTQGPAGPRENDIADPFGSSLATARAVVAEIAAAVGLVVAGLELAPSTAGR